MYSVFVHLEKLSHWLYNSKMKCDFNVGEGRSELKFEIKSRSILVSEVFKQRKLFCEYTVP